MNPLKIVWPWNHSEVAQHLTSVENRDEVVDRIFREATRQKRENGLGKAVQNALSGKRKPQ